ncbi:MAG: ABC transporter permease [Acidobacteria bacterium]|nr:ABC transporter permease [Acidobacteriota bacterium]MBV9475581.1 ABC transporter permease [Acidobacteriota bacterium]
MNGKVFGALLLRDAIVARREIVALLVRTAFQPVLLVVVFGYVLPSMGMIPRGYATTMVPGVAALCLSMASLMSVAMPLVVDFGFTKEIEDRLLAPIATDLIAVEKVIVGALQGFVSAAIVLPLSYLVSGRAAGLSLSHPLLLIVVMLLTGAAFSSFGLWLGTVMQAQQMQVIISVIFVPMIMFGCVYYPWSGLEHLPVLKYAVLINPVVYASEGLRASLTPAVPHMPLVAIFGALLVSLAVLLSLGLRSFRKKAIT